MDKYRSKDHLVRGWGGDGWGVARRGLVIPKPMCRVWNIQNYGCEQKAEPSTKHFLGDKQRAWDGIKPDDEESKQQWVWDTHHLLIPSNFTFSNTVGIQKCIVILRNTENNKIHILSWAQPRFQGGLRWLGMKCYSTETALDSYSTSFVNFFPPSHYSSSWNKWDVSFPDFSAPRDRHLT